MAKFEKKDTPTAGNIGVNDIIAVLPTIDFIALQTIADAVNAQITTKQEATRNALRDQWLKAQEQYAIEAQKLGFSLVEVTSRKMKPKYRHPDNHSLTWTGQGRQPKWLQGFLEVGRTAEEFLIEKPVADDKAA